MPYEKLNLLSLPTSAAKAAKCHYCGAASRHEAVRCTLCSASYCCKEHYELDQAAAHHVICPDIRTLRDATTESARAAALAHAATASRAQVQRFISRQNFAAALPAATHCLDFYVRLYGSSSLHLARPRLLLAEAALGLGQLEDAERHITIARVLVLQHHDTADLALAGELTGRLHRQAVRLFISLHRSEAALHEVSLDCVHTAAAAHSPDTLCSTPPLVLLSQVTENIDPCSVHVQKRVLFVWWNWLVKRGLAAGESLVNGVPTLQFDASIEDSAEDAGIAVEMLEIIPKIFAKFQAINPLSRETALSAVISGLLFEHDDRVLAKQYSTKALETLRAPGGLCENGTGEFELDSDGIYGDFNGPSPAAILATAEALSLRC